MSTTTATTTTQEAVMGQPFPTQHPAIVLRSHYKLVRGLLAVAMLAIVALSAAVVIVANDDNTISQTARPAELQAAPNSAVHSHPLSRPDARYDGGPEEGTAGSAITSSAASAPAARYDGGPEEGTRSIEAPAPGPAPERTTDTGGDGTSVLVTPQGPGAR